MQILGNLAVKFGYQGNININVHSVSKYFLGKVAKFGGRSLYDFFLSEGDLKSLTAWIRLSSSCCGANQEPGLLRFVVTTAIC